MIWMASAWGVPGGIHWLMVRKAWSGLGDTHPLKAMAERSKMIFVKFEFTVRYGLAWISHASGFW